VQGSATFFFAPQLPLDAAGMNLHAEALADPLGQLIGTDTRIGGARLRDELQHRWGELVAGMRSGLVGNQASQAPLLECLLGLVERRAREPTGLGGLADRSLVDIDQSQHLVLDLQQVVGIEELAAREQRVRDATRARVERGVLPQDLLLVVLGSIYRHTCLRVGSEARCT
jgi:hypothetical protein